MDRSNREIKNIHIYNIFLAYILIYFRNVKINSILNISKYLYETIGNISI